VDSFGSYQGPARADLEAVRTGVRSARPVRRLTGYQNAAGGENSPKVNKPPFRSRRGSLTADFAAARIHFRRASHSHDISLTEMRAVIRAQRYGDVP
jgi:hypothetical protein